MTCCHAGNIGHKAHQVIAQSRIHGQVAPLPTLGGSILIFYAPELVLIYQDTMYNLVIETTT